MPAASRTICIGSLYWRAKACQRGSFAASAKRFGPNLARRASTSDAARPDSAFTPWPSRAASTVRACQATSGVAAGAAVSVIGSFLPGLGGACRPRARASDVV